MRCRNVGPFYGQEEAGEDGLRVGYWKERGEGGVGEVAGGGVGEGVGSDCYSPSCPQRRGRDSVQLAACSICYILRMAKHD